MFQSCHFVGMGADGVLIDHDSPERDFRLVKHAFIDVQSHSYILDYLENAVEDSFMLGFVDCCDDHVVMDHMNFIKVLEEGAKCFGQLAG